MPFGQREKVLAYDKNGPFGSVDPVHPIDLQTAHAKLNAKRDVGNSRELGNI